MAKKTEETQKQTVVAEWNNATKFYMAEGEYTGVVVGKDATQSEYVISNGVMAPGSLIPNHYHKWEDQTFHVIEGELLAKIGDEVKTIRAGDSAHCPRGVTHFMKNVGDKPAKMISYIFPGDWAEDFMAETSRQNDAGAPDFELIEERFGIVYLPNPDIEG